MTMWICRVTTTRWICLVKDVLSLTLLGLLWVIVDANAESTMCAVVNVRLHHEEILEPDDFLGKGNMRKETAIPVNWVTNGF